MRLNTKPMFIEIDGKKILMGMVDIEEWFIRDCLTNAKLMRKAKDEVDLE
jgi:hypothetical protein